MKQKIIPIDVNTIKLNVIEIIKDIDIVSPIKLLFPDGIKMTNYHTSFTDKGGILYRYSGNFKKLPDCLLDYLENNKKSYRINYTITENYPRIPMPKYSYGYMDIKIKCRWCKKKSKLSKLQDYEDDDTYLTNICPKCENANCLKVNLVHQHLSDEQLEIIRTNHCT